MEVKVKLYFNTNRPALPQNFMLALQFSVFALGIGLSLWNPVGHKSIFSITCNFYKWSITLGLNGYLA